MHQEAPKRGFNPLTSIARWFDSSIPAETRGIPGHAKRVDWFRSLPFFAMHVVCLGVIWVGWSWVAVAVAAGLYFIRMFAITGFYHRYFSHRTFKTNRFWQFVFAALGSSAVQRGPLWWAAHHRHHHRHSDKEDDAHSPHTHGLLWSHMLWFTSAENHGTKLKEVRDLAKYPELRFLNRFDVAMPVALAVAVFSLGVGLNALWPQLGTSGMQMLVWGFFISTVVLFHGTCTINSLSHMMGRARYKTGDHSRNSLILSLVTLGEGWHNNHHHYPATVRQGFFWWEIDITYYMLRVMSWTGIVWDLKELPEHVRANPKALAGGS